MKRITAIVLALCLLLCMAGLAETMATEVPTLTVTSDILGMCDTGNKTSLKVDLIYTSGPGDVNLYHYDENGKRVIYDDEKNIAVPLDPVQYTGEAVLTLEGDVDDAKIDASGAVVRLVDGSSYYADEFILNATALTNDWVNGSTTYALDTGDLEFNTWDYDTTVDYNSGREWSIMGGDGNGVYFFNLEVSGILYDGQEVAPATFPVAVYCYGRTCTDLALSTEFVENTVDEDFTEGVAPTDEPQWLWHSDNEAAVADGKPYLNDTVTDYFTVVWPEGTDASDISEEDVTITLRSNFGEEYVLSPVTAYGEREYAVIPRDSETVIAVTYQQWAYVPVFSHMDIEVSSGDNAASHSWDVASVAAYMTQTGGGGVTVDHTVTCYNYYGVKGMTADNAMNATYTLSAEIDGKTVYYAEDEAGNGYLSEGVETANAWGMTSTAAPEDAAVYDATDIYHLAVRGNVVFAETRVDSENEIFSTEDKVVDGETVTFTRQTSFTRNIDEMIADGAVLDDGYNLSNNGAAKWAWTMRYQSGWTTVSEKPVGLPYAEGNYPYGYAPGESNEVYQKLKSGELTDGESSTGGMSGPGGGFGGPDGNKGLGGPGGPDGGFGGPDGDDGPDGTVGGVGGPGPNN